MNKEELMKKIKEAKTMEEVEELRSQVAALEIEKKKEELEKELSDDSSISKEEERKLIRETDPNEKEERKFVKVEKKGDEEMNEEKRSLEEVLKSEEYRSAWAKSLMGRTDLTEKEKRALGDAITTTSTTFVASDADTQGINNGGLFIPTNVRLDMLNIIEKTSPFLRDVKKVYVAGNIDFPYLNSADDANWTVELTDTKNEGQEYKALKLTGNELAKQVEITWKLEAMAVDEFISFITTELANKMGRALANAVIYGTGTNQPTGALNSLSAVEGDNVIDAVLNAYKSLGEDFRIGAKSYISSSYAIDLVGYKDANGNYPFLQGLRSTDVISIEEDPYLKSTDILVGNPANYVLNTVEDISITRETKVTARRNIYASYAIYDGKPMPNAFAKGTVASIPSV
ncbi:MAG TPA: phage major capsid protein [Candidatus Onthousia faecavium]|nr:phage major capsid protein [Candidatus Onthousia faecavium]